jgi:hypothetical protein
MSRLSVEGKSFEAQIDQEHSRLKQTTKPELKNQFTRNRRGCEQQAFEKADAGMVEVRVAL